MNKLKIPENHSGVSKTLRLPENIVEDVQDIFDEMGNMEGVQLYDNVEGGIGHVSAVNSSTYIFYPDSNQ